MSDLRKYREIFDYLSAESLPDSPEPAVVFGRDDLRVAYAAGELVVAGLTDTLVITGGVGKDTGTLLDQGYSSEADYLGVKLLDYTDSHGCPEPYLLFDEKACHGGENARYSLAKLVGAGIAINSLTAVPFPTSARRLAGTLQFETDKRIGKLDGTGTATVHVKPSKYQFHADRPSDQIEAAKELLRVADWPEAGLLHPQPDLDLELVEFARARHPGTPFPPSPLTTFMLRRLPPRARIKAIELMTNRT